MQATSTEVVNHLFWEFFWLALAVAVFALGWLLVALIRFRDRPGMAEPADLPAAGRFPAERGNKFVLAVFVVVPLVIVIGLDIIDQEPLRFLKEVPADAALTVRAESYQWAWDFTYPEGFTLRNELRVPEGHPVVLQITSRDVLHAFYVADFAVKQDAVPGQLSTLWFNATGTGTYRAQCAEYCGLGHSKMISTVVVMEPGEFDAWRAARAKEA
jgi:cytochrome c oxidase subunit 2